MKLSLKFVPEFVDLGRVRVPSSRSIRKVSGRLMSQDKKNRNSFPLIFAYELCDFIPFRVSRVSGFAGEDEFECSGNLKGERTNRRRLEWTPVKKNYNNNTYVYIYIYITGSPSLSGLGGSGAGLGGPPYKRKMSNSKK